MSRRLDGLEVLEQRQPVLLERGEHSLVRQVLFEELVEAQTFDPLHLDQGIVVSADPDPLLLVFERDEVWQVAVAEVVRDLGVAAVQVRDVAEEALDRPAVAPVLELVDAGELPADRAGQAKLVHHGHTLLELGPREGGGRNLDRLLVVGHGGPECVAGAGHQSVTSTRRRVVSSL
ncbi:MAG: hypothetical protein ACYSU2_17745 [Planctomycetota bacterium]|jgi:hypothetical protein